MNDEFEPLAPVEVPIDWVGGLKTFAALIFVYWLVG